MKATCGKEIDKRDAVADSNCLVFLFFFLVFTSDNLHGNINPYELVSTLHVLPQSSYTQLTVICVFYA